MERINLAFEEEELDPSDTMESEDFADFFFCFLSFFPLAFPLSFLSFEPSESESDSSSTDSKICSRTRSSLVSIPSESHTKKSRSACSKWGRGDDQQTKELFNWYRSPVRTRCRNSKKVMDRYTTKFTMRSIRKNGLRRQNFNVRYCVINKRYVLDVIFSHWTSEGTLMMLFLNRSIGVICISKSNSLIIISMYRNWYRYRFYSILFIN